MASRARCRSDPAGRLTSRLLLMSQDRLNNRATDNLSFLCFNGQAPPEDTGEDSNAEDIITPGLSVGTRTA